MANILELPRMPPTSRKSVAIGPGHTAVALMPLGFSSSSMPSVKDDTYALEAEYTVMRGLTQNEAMELTLRIRPPAGI